MVVFRALIFLALLASALSFVLYILTSQLRFRRWGILTLLWTLAAAFIFFAVLIVQRVA
ncbi:hypothetical protein SAMN05216344_10177 [Polaromonas sp. OV174]|uniref:hypothetical protein n=1 Tax=Polaromonas sp. OV174 TaxID=1855300 RepID=UPI0008EEFA04|nr:hypothetical protein [Polaromonas sp. OV174]SFB67354.1 hypothetical protein SAMN05216344_10177 [Polaromonas sp. OV174]